MEFVRAMVDLASVAAPILLLALRETGEKNTTAVVEVFSPVSRFSRWFASAIFSEFYLLFLGYTFGVAFLAPPVFSPLLSLLGWLALGVLPAGHLLWWSLPICLGFLSITAVLCLLPLLLLGVG